MATNVNRTELTGNLGNDPEARYTATGTLVVTASIAVHSSYKQGDAWQERTDWFRLVAFGEAGEALSRFGKGERIRVLGRDSPLRQRPCREICKIVGHNHIGPRPNGRSENMMVIRIGQCEDGDQLLIACD